MVVTIGRHKTCHVIIVLVVVIIEAAAVVVVAVVVVAVVVVVVVAVVVVVINRGCYNSPSNWEGQLINNVEHKCITNCHTQ